MQKERQSNMELLRIVAMLFVVLLHCNYYALGWEDTFDIHTIGGFTRVFFEQLTIVCVDVFVLISGWFGINAKLKGALSLWFQVVYFSLVVAIFCQLAGIHYSVVDIVKPFFFGWSYWFVPAYLVLYAVSPILNAFIEHASKSQFRNVLISFFVLEFALGWFEDIACFQDGNSALSFIGLYLLARYIRLYPSAIFSQKWYVDASIYFLLSLIPAIVELFVDPHGAIANSHIAFSSPFVIGASVFLMLTFSKFKIRSNAINWLASSAFAVYLLHAHASLKHMFPKVLSRLYDSMAGYEYVLLCIVVAIALLVVSAIIDKPRIFLWKKISASRSSHK